MSFFYLLVFLFFALSFSFNFRKTLLCYAPIKLILNNGICLYDNVQYLPLDLAISSVAVAVYALTKKNKKNKIPTLLLISCCIYCLSTFIFGSFPRFAAVIFFNEPISDILYCLLLFKVISNKSDLNVIIKGLCIVSIVLIMDGTIDLLTGVNPIIEFETWLSGEHFWHSENEEMRGGLPRTTSFMPHSVSMGSLAALLWGVLLIIYSYDKSYRKNKLFLTSLFLLPLMIIFSNSRTPIITMLCFLPVLISSKIGFGIRQSVILLLLFLSIYFSDYLLWIYNSIFNESSTNVAGSTTELRESQFNLAMYYFLQEPIWGMGNSFNILDYEAENDAMGMESVWFPLFYLRGLVGVVPYILMLLTGIYIFFKSRKNFVWFAIAWIASTIFSSQVGISIYLYLIVIVLSLKLRLLIRGK